MKQYNMLELIILKIYQVIRVLSYTTPDGNFTFESSGSTDPSSPTNPNLNPDITINQDMLIEVTYGTTIRIGAADNSSHNCFVKLQHREIANGIWKTCTNSYVSTTLHRRAGDNANVGNNF